MSALLAYLAVRGKDPGPLFKMRDGRFLTKEIFIERVRAALDILGLDGSMYAGQFQDWCGVNSSRGRHRGLDHQDVRLVGEFRLSIVCEGASSDVGVHIGSVGC